MVDRKVRPVSFNLDDLHEKRLLDHANQYIFSKYVKRLIERDMNGMVEVNDEPETFKGNPMGFI